MDLRRVVGSVAVLAVGWAVISLGFRLWDGELSEREAIHQAAVRQVLAGSRAWQAQVDSLKGRERAALARADSLAAAIEAGRPELAGLRAAFVLEPSSASGVPERLVGALEVQVRRLELQVMDLRAGYQLAVKRADRAEARVHVLEPLLQEAEKLRRCRIAGLVPCPSRQISYLAGVVTGIAVMVTASRQ